MIRITFLLVFGWLSRSNIYAQIADNTDRHNERNVYYQALVQYFKPDSIGNFGILEKMRDTFYVYDWRQELDSLPKTIGHITIVLVEDAYAFIKSRNWHDVTLYRLSPLKHNDGEFSVGVSPLVASANRKRKHFVNLAWYGGCTIYFGYAKGSFRFLRKQCGAI